MGSWKFVQGVLFSFSALVQFRMGQILISLVWQNRTKENCRNGSTCYLKHYGRGEAGTAQAEQFAIQLDKRTYVSNKAQLMRVPEEVENLKHILLFKSLKGNAAGRETFNVIYYMFSVHKRSSGSGVNLYTSTTQ